MARIKFDFRKLRAKMTEKGFTIESLAKATGISFSTLAVHLSKGIAFNGEHAFLIAQALEADNSELNGLFFTIEL